MELITFTEPQVDLIKRTLLDTERVTFSSDELALFINQCKRTGLDPFTRQIYATKNQGKVSIQATIDGLRLIAERSQKYAGQTRPTFFDADGNEYKVWPKSKGLPYACEVGVLRHDFKEPVYAIAIFDEYAQKIKDFKTNEQKLGFMWAKMPSLMLQKVAEALALRKAFPNDLSGIYSTEEMSQTIEKEVIPNDDNGSNEPQGVLSSTGATESRKKPAALVVPQVQQPEPLEKPKTKRVAPSLPQEAPDLTKPRNMALANYNIKGGPLCKYPNLGKVPEFEARKWVDSVDKWAQKPDVTIPEDIREAVSTVKEYWGWL